MKRTHSNEEPVMRYCAILDSDLNLRKKRRQAIFDDLRKKGNFIYNQNVLRDSVFPVKVKSLLPVKRKSGGKESVCNHIICKVCQGLYSRKTFHKHASLCGALQKNDQDGCDIDEQPIRNSFVKTLGLEIHQGSEKASQLMKEKIFKILRKDEKGFVAIQDPLIVSVGSDFLASHCALKDRYNVTRKMRDAGYLLIKMREKDHSILSFKDCFYPKQMDNLLSAVQEICGLDSETGMVEIIGMPARLAWVIQESASKLLDEVICNPEYTDNRKEIMKTSLLDFMAVFKRRWKYTISTNAEISRKRKAMQKPVVMPDDDDIRIMNEKVAELEELYYNDLKKTVTIENYERLCQITIAKMILFNRRRAGEVARAELEFYLNRPNNQNTMSPEILSQLTETEKITMKNLEVIIVPGKIIRAVPILITKSMARNIDFIIACRDSLKIPANNNLLFARPGTENPFVGSSILRDIRQLLSLKKPYNLTSTGLRHHCATMTQVNGKHIETEDLAEFMGHTVDIHKRKYRYPLEAIQRGKIANHLLSLGGMTIKDITSENMQTEATHSQLEEFDFTSEPSPGQPEKENLSNIKRKKWTDDEKSIVIDTFKNFIKSSRTPGTKLCQELIQNEPLLKGRTWAQINTLVDNYNRGKLKLPIEFRYLNKRLLEN